MAYYELSRSSASLSKTYINRDGTENFNFPLHFHTSYEILYVHDGEIEVVIDKSVYHPIKGELVLIPPDKAHSYRTADYSVVSIGIFNTDYLSEIREEIRSGILRYPVIPNAEKLFEELCLNQSDHFLFKSVLYRIAAIYSKNEIIQELPKNNSDFARNFYEYIQNHYKQHINEKNVAMALGYNTRYLSHLINKEFGASFRDVLNECRIKEACRLLQNGKISITEVYLEAGFDSQCTFNRNFKSIMGITPIKYKQDFSHGMSFHSMKTDTL